MERNTSEKPKEWKDIDLTTRISLILFIIAIGFIGYATLSTECEIDCNTCTELIITKAQQNNITILECPEGQLPILKQKGFK